MPSRVVINGTEVELSLHEEVHYTAKVKTDKTTIEAAKWWLSQARKVLTLELSEEIVSGQYKVGSDWWQAQVYKRALEMIEADDDMRPGYTTKLQVEIEDKALYGAAGYSSSEEWFKSESSLRKGGLASNMKWWGEFLIPWCKQNAIFDSPGKADEWFYTPLNADGSSRYGALRDATTDLRDIADRNVYDLAPSDQIKYVRQILGLVERTDITRQQKAAELNQIRFAKMELEIYQDESGWHVKGDLTDHQIERLKHDLMFSAIIKIVDAPETDVF